MTVDATRLLRCYASWRISALSRQDVVGCQTRALLSLARRAAKTQFGLAHDFGSIRTVRDFQSRVPLRRYEAFWKEYWSQAFPRLDNITWPGPTRFLALSSGTSTGTTKYIPVTPSMARSNCRSALDVLVFHLRNCPASHVLAGRNFMLGGSTALKHEGEGVQSGDLSGIAAAQVPPWARPWYFPPRLLALIPDWERKIDTLAPQSLAADIRSISGTPSWLLIFFDRLLALHPDRAARLASFYPQLELLVHGGVSFAPYRERFAAWLEGSHAELREVYAASEGFIAVADRGTDQGMRLLLDNGLFFEFVPVEELNATNPIRHWIDDVQIGTDYALVLSTCAGLWSYVFGDIVRLVDRDPPRLLVVGRASYFLSAFGEHLTGEELEHAVLDACRRIGRNFVEFVIGPLPFSVEQPCGRHVYILELDGNTPSQAELAAAAIRIDENLSRRNDDYRAHRVGGQLLPPILKCMPPGGFERWMKIRGRLGGQNKVPRVVNDPALLASLLEMVQDEHQS